MNIYEKTIKDLQSRVKALEERLTPCNGAVAEHKKWSPVGGDWCIYSDDDIQISYEATKNFGLERPTKEQAKRAAVEMRKFNRLLALRDELCGDETFDSWNCEDNNIPKYYLNFNHYNYDKMIWDFEINYYVNYIGICFSSAETAQKACDMLNSGEVEL